MFSPKIISLLGFVACAQAHIIMTYPPPFEFEDLSMKQAPLQESGADFPCKLPGGSYVPGPQGTTEMPIGSTHALSFIGSAVHGGGSCQVSITYDKKPTKNSVWKVIHSIQGGCPMRNIKGNNGNDALKIVPDTYSFKIPDALPAGEAVLAWTWFNNVGNREMYMNCAPIKITGSGASDKTKYNGLPALYMANVGNGCTTDPNKNVKFPNPGASLEVNNGGLPEDTFVGSAKCEQFGGTPQAPAPVPSAAPPSSSAAAPLPPTSSVAASLPGGIFVTVNPSKTLLPAQPTAPASSSSSATTSPTTKPAVSTSAIAKPPVPTTPPATTLTVVPVKPTSVVTPPTPSPAPPTTPGPSGVQNGPCTQEGRWNCINGTAFQQCASGSWSQAQNLAAGTKCTAGQSDAIDIQAIGVVAPAAKPPTKRRSRINKKHMQQHKRHSS